MVSALDSDLSWQERLVLEVLEDILRAWILRLIDLGIIYHEVVPILLVIGQ